MLKMDKNVDNKIQIVLYKIFKKWYENTTNY